MKLDMAERVAKQQEKIQHIQYQSKRACEAEHIRDGNFKACQ